MTLFVALTLVLAVLLSVHRRLDPLPRAVLWLAASLVALLVSAFVIVAPALRPARSQLVALQDLDGGQLLLFLLAAASFGVAAASLLAAQFVHALGVILVRQIRDRSRRNRPAPVTEAPAPRAVSHDA